MLNILKKFLATNFEMTIVSRVNNENYYNQDIYNSINVWFIYADIEIYLLSNNIGQFYFIFFCTMPNVEISYIHLQKRFRCDEIESFMRCLGRFGVLTLWVTVKFALYVTSTI